MPKALQKRRKISPQRPKYRKKLYAQSILLGISILVTIFIATNDVFHQYLLHLGTLEYVGAFLAGFFWVSTMTIAPASVVLIILSENLPIWSVAIIGGLGALVGDSTIFQFVRTSSLTDELFEIFNRFGGRRIIHIFQSQHLRWTWPLIGALIIISPLPDEIGVSLLGVSKLGYPSFALISLVLNTLGIVLLLFTFSGITP